MEERKKTAREIIEGYQGPPVRIMEVCGTTRSSVWGSAGFCRRRWS